MAKPLCRLMLIHNSNDQDLRFIISNWFNTLKNFNNPNPTLQNEGNKNKFIQGLTDKWSDFYDIESIFDELEIPFTGHRLSQKQFSNFINIIEKHGIEASLDKENELGLNDDTPGVNSQISLRNPNYISARKQIKTSSNVAHIANSTFQEADNESEVESFFIMPFLNKLGYKTQHIAMRHPILIQEGSKKNTKKSDIVVFADNSKTADKALILFEAKNPKIKLNREHVQQALSYTPTLKPAYTIVTNSIEMIILQNNEIIFRINISDLSNHWDKIYKVLNPQNTEKEKKEILARYKKYGL